MYDRHFVSSRRLGLGFILGLGIVAFLSTGCAREAPQSFEEQNGLLEAAAFDEAKEAFAEVEEAADGLGVHFNDSSCAACHPAPGKQLPGGSSAVTELRVGHVEGGKFVPAAGGTLITLQALPGFMSEVSALPDSENVRDRFISPSLFGVGFVEAVADETLRGIAQEQALKTKNRIRGLVREVDVLEASGKRAVGRFGWAAQHASLLSFSADAYRNEMGITSALQPTDNTFFGQPVDDGIADPEDKGGQFGEDVEFFASFMRALSAPPRVFPSDGSGRTDIDAGQKIFELIGCDVCHRPTLVTADTGAPMNGGAMSVPSALGRKTIHPFGDFLMHDIGTGSAIVREGTPAETAGKVRTAPLWGLGTRQNKSLPLLHDGSAKTLPEAIQRHRNTAAEEATKFQQLPEVDKAKVLRFLQSL
jgi:CxxC motif-containing protein (DUF1111 family)